MGNIAITRYDESLRLKLAMQKMLIEDNDLK